MGSAAAPGLRFDAPRIEHLFPGIRDDAPRTTREARVLPRQSRLDEFTTDGTHAEKGVL
jgi:hypothetical protein